MMRQYARLYQNDPLSLKAQLPDPMCRLAYQRANDTGFSAVPKSAVSMLNGHSGGLLLDP